MSIYWMNRIWELSNQKGSGLLTQLAIADNANDAGVAWPGYATLARKTRLSTRNVQRIVERMSESNELAYYQGGAGRRSTNIYVLLVGREAAEIDAILKMLKQKHVNLSTLKAGQFVYLDKLSMTKKAVKLDTAVSREPSRTMNDHEWMNDDPICLFLKGLPGFNPDVIQATRLEIVSHHYDLGELPYLWNECALADNPIGLFTHKVSGGHHSVDWQMLQLQRAGEEERQRLAAEQHAATEQVLAKRAATRQMDATPESQVTQDQFEIWQGILSELRFDAQPRTYEQYIAPAYPVSVNGSWTIAVPAVEWWSSMMPTSLKRIYRKITGEQTEFVFVKDDR